MDRARPPSTTKPLTSILLLDIQKQGSGTLIVGASSKPRHLVLSDAPAGRRTTLSCFDPVWHPKRRRCIMCQPIRRDYRLGLVTGKEAGKEEISNLYAIQGPIATNAILAQAAPSVPVRPQ